MALLVSALGPPPADVVAAMHDRGVILAGMAGTPRHAVKQVRAGVDIVIAVGMEAGGHTGTLSTMVLTPQVVSETTVAMSQAGLEAELLGMPVRQVVRAMTDPAAVREIVQRSRRLPPASTALQQQVGA